MPPLQILTFKYMFYLYSYLHCIDIGIFKKMQHFPVAQRTAELQLFKVGVIVFLQNMMISSKLDTAQLCCPLSYGEVLHLLETFKPPSVGLKWVRAWQDFESSNTLVENRHIKSSFFVSHCNFKFKFDSNQHIL